MNCKQYYIDTDKSPQELGFHYIGDETYIHKFPVYKWKGYTTIVGRFITFENDNTVYIDVFKEDGELYAPFYKDILSDSKVLNIIYANIRKELKLYNIKTI